MMKGMSPPSKAGVETMKSMGNMPSPQLLTTTARHASLFPKNTAVGRAYANKMKAQREMLRNAPKIKTSTRPPPPKLKKTKPRRNK